MVLFLPPLSLRICQHRLSPQREPALQPRIGQALQIFSDCEAVVLQEARDGTVVLTVRVWGRKVHLFVGGNFAACTKDHFIKMVDWVQTGDALKAVCTSDNLVTV